MAVTEILALFAATVGAEARAGGELPAHLGVTATVVRPAEILTVSGAPDGTVAVVRNSGSVEVLAVGGTVAHGDDHTAIVSSDAADVLFITLVY